MLFLIILPMLVSLLLIALLGHRVRSDLLAIAGCGSSLFFSVYYLLANFGGSIVDSYSWFSIGASTFDISLIGNNLTLIMALLVSIISLLILIFSVFYMEREAKERYYSQLSFFVFSMLGLVLSGSFILFYLFWEFVGVASYMLIGFWYRREAAAAAGKKALIITRIGDLSLLSAIIVLFAYTGTFSISSALSLISQIPHVVLLTSAILIIIAALAKSAQFPFYTWLPDAMEGPSTVSALLHSATMVAAGAFLLVLMYPLLSSAGALSIIVGFSMLTSIVAVLLMLRAVKFKVIMAYSTIESLSFMFFAIGTANVGGSLFYLMTHAVFKSLMFLISGVMLVLLGTQDIHELSTKKLRNTWLFIPLIVGGSSIAAIPPFMSFFVHSALFVGSNAYEIVFYALISALTAIASFRLVFTLIRPARGGKLERPIAAILPIAVLSLIATGGGFSLFYFGSIIPLTYMFDVPFVFSTISALIGLGIAYYLFYAKRMSGILSISNRMVDALQGITFNQISNYLGNLVVRTGYVLDSFDGKLSRAFEVGSVISFSLSSKFRSLQNGNVETYITAILIGLIGVLAVAVFFV